MKKVIIVAMCLWLVFGAASRAADDVKLILSFEKAVAEKWPNSNVKEEYPKGTYLGGEFPAGSFAPLRGVIRRRFRILPDRSGDSRQTTNPHTAQASPPAFVSPSMACVQRISTDMLFRLPNPCAG